MTNISEKLDRLADAADGMAAVTTDIALSSWLDTLRAELEATAESARCLEAHIAHTGDHVVIPAAHRFRGNATPLPRPWGPGSAA